MQPKQAHRHEEAEAAELASSASQAAPLDPTRCFRCGGDIQPGEGKLAVTGSVGRHDREELVSFCARRATEQNVEDAQAERTGAAARAELDAEFERESKPMEGNVRSEGRLQLLLAVPFFLAILAFICWLLFAR
jgi:hypothetical protein